MSDTLSIRETAARLGVGTSTLYRAAADGQPILHGETEIYPIRIAGRLVYSRRAIDLITEQATA